VLISTIFYKQLYHTEIFCAAFMFLMFVILIFWQKEIVAKTACKILAKLTTAGKHGSNLVVGQSFFGI